MASSDFYKRVKAASQNDRRGLSERREARQQAPQTQEEALGYDLGDAIVKSEKLAKPVTVIRKPLFDL